MRNGQNNNMRSRRDKTIERLGNKGNNNPCREWIWFLSSGGDRMDR